MTAISVPFFKPAGDQAVLVVFGDEIDLQINRLVHSLDQNLETDPFDGLIETVPTYTSLLNLLRFFAYELC